MDANINAALIILDRALDEIETGFMACELCGAQESTNNLDFVDDLKDVKKELIAFVDSQKPTN